MPIQTITVHSEIDKYGTVSDIGVGNQNFERGTAFCPKKHVNVKKQIFKYVYDLT